MTKRNIGRWYAYFRLGGMRALCVADLAEGNL